MSNKVIIPYNFTVNDEKSIDFVIERYRDVKDVSLTLFHIYREVPEVYSKSDPLMEKMNRAGSFFRQQLHEHEKGLEVIKERLVLSGFNSNNVQCLFSALKDDIATDLIGQIKKDNYDTVVLNHNPGNIINFFTRSVSKRVFQILKSRVSIHIVN